jgi:ribose transport system ATP-binding protein
MDTPFLQIKNVSKNFPGVKALDAVNIDIYRGEIHVLVGENGAGKSTLIKILTGVYRHDAGEILLNGQKIKDLTPQKALHELGIVPIYQELNMVPMLSVAENIFMGREIYKNKTLGIIDREAMKAKTAEILRELGQDIDPACLVKNLGVGKQQMVEIAKALSIEAQLIIFDEPTAALGEEEIEELFRIMRKLKNNQVTLIFISHKLDEVKKIGDRVTVLRDARHIVTKPVAELSEDDIVRYMVGKEITNKFPKIMMEKGEQALRVVNLNRKGVLHNISFEAYRSQILGVAGLVGAGRTELARAIIGADAIDSGEIYINNRRVNIKCPKDALEQGLVLLTEDRKNQGLFLDETLVFNCTIANLDQYRQRLLLCPKRQREDTQRLVDRLKLKTSSLHSKAMQLSGGNQQKLVISKWLNTQAHIFIFDEPTRGIDVGAKEEVYMIINHLLEDGAAVIVISSELPEILGISDRIIVLHSGKITGIFNRAEATQEKIMKAATGGSEYAS